MKFKIGDRFNFLDEKGGGIVTKITDDNVVYVEIEDEFEVPVAASNLILTSTEEGYSAREDDLDNHNEVKKSYQTGENITPLKTDEKDLHEEGIYFAIIPEDQEKPLAGNLMLYLANQTDYQILFSLFTNESGTFYGFDFGYLEPRSKIYLDSISRTKIELWVNALVQVVFFKEGKTTILRPLSRLIDFKPVKTYKEDAFRYYNMLENKAIMIKLGLTKNQTSTPYVSKEVSDDNLSLLKEKLISEHKFKTGKPGKERAFLDKHNIGEKVAEVDLHIHKLVDDFTNLENKDLINIQIEYFKKCLEQAVKDKYRKLIFIHGIGDGVLKNEILKHLKKTDGVQYYDAPYNRYGFGATEVRFYRNK